MHTIQWTVRVGNLPQIVKKCPRCHCGRFENSGCFRVNANGNRLYVWLVFRCAECKATWNMRVYDRIGRDVLEKAEYAALMRNDEHLVRRVSFDEALLLRNHVSIDPDSAALQIDGDDIPAGEAADVTLLSEVPLHLSACAVIAEKLGVSKSRVRKLEENGFLIIDGGVKKRRVGVGFHFLLREGWSPD